MRLQRVIVEHRPPTGLRHIMPSSFTVSVSDVSAFARAVKAKVYDARHVQGRISWSQTVAHSDVLFFR